MNEQNSSPITCRECGCIIEGTPIYLDGDPYCPECAEANAEELGYVGCSECGAWIPEEETRAYKDGFICEACADDLCLEECDECGELTADATIVFGRYGERRRYCRSCLEAAFDRAAVFYCESCDEYYEARWCSSYETNSGEIICENCYSNYYDRCPNCNGIFLRDDMLWSDGDNDYYCEDCYYGNGHDHSGDDCIHDYSYKPSPCFHGIRHLGSPRSDDPITLGFELEVDEGNNRNDCACALDNYFSCDTLYMKNDSSVDFEIVTHPHTLEKYLNDFDFDRLCKIPADYGYKSHDAGTCGFHIHVGRAQLGSTDQDRVATISRIALLMFRHWKAVVIFSRRTESQLNSWASAPSFSFDTLRTKYDERSLTQYVDNYYLHAGRYQALNLCPCDTIEFRLWRGSLKPETLKATLQLTSNIVMFAKTHTMYDVVKSGWEDIAYYETCPELESYLADRELTSFTDLQTIPWANKVDIPPRELKNGDHVMISNAYGGLVSSSMIGFGGYIVGSAVSNGEIQYAIHLNEPIPQRVLNLCTHSCSGLVPDSHGYWAFAENLTVLEPADTADGAIGF